MEFTATWYAGETAISSARASNFAASRDIAKCRMAAHRVRSGATHVQVCSPDGALIFDSREGGTTVSASRLTLTEKLIRAIDNAARAGKIIAAFCAHSNRCC